MVQLCTSCNGTGFCLCHVFSFSSTLLISVESRKNFIWRNNKRKDEAKQGYSLLKLSVSHFFLRQEKVKLDGRHHFKIESFLLHTVCHWHHWLKDLAIKLSRTLGWHSIYCYILGNSIVFLAGSAYVNTCSIVGYGFSFQDSRSVTNLFYEGGQVAWSLWV